MTEPRIEPRELEVRFSQSPKRKRYEKPPIEERIKIFRGKVLVYIQSRGIVKCLFRKKHWVVEEIPDESFRSVTIRRGEKFWWHPKQRLARPWKHPYYSEKVFCG